VLKICSDSLETSARKLAKSKNKKGTPISLGAKALAVVADPYNSQIVYVADAAGRVRQINVQVNELKSCFNSLFLAALQMASAL